MAYLDVFIEKLLSEKAVEVRFESDEAAALHLPNGEVWPARTPIGAIELINYVAEVLPPALRSTFPHDGTAEFGVGAGQSRVAVHFEKRGGKIKMSIRPDPDGSHAPWPRIFRANDAMFAAFSQLLSRSDQPQRIAA